MMVARREAILAKGCGYYEQAMVEAWAGDGVAERIPRYLQQIADPELIVLIAEAGDDVHTMGADLWPYGARENWPLIEGFIHQLRADGLLDRDLTIAEVFAAPLIDSER
jgi:hypothetical protein